MHKAKSFYKDKLLAKALAALKMHAEKATEDALKLQTAQSFVVNNILTRALAGWQFSIKVGLAADLSCH